MTTIVLEQVNRRGSSLSAQLTAIAIGVALLTAMAQVSIPLPFTPVPLTGQTFAVLLLGLLWGARLALFSSLTYLTMGALGLPVFAAFKAGLGYGPTSGYLVGMVFASYFVGWLTEQGWNKTWLKTFISLIAGEFIIFSFGLLVLHHFVPNNFLLSSGLLPFIPGELLKITTLVALSRKA